MASRMDLNTFAGACGCTGCGGRRSGTSGGVLAPILMIGAALGEAAAQLARMPPEIQALWALMAMGAMLSGALGVPLTAILFSLELTDRKSTRLNSSHANISY